MSPQTKQKIIQGITVGGKIAGVVAGGAAYEKVIPPQYLPLAVLAFAVASALKEILTAFGVYLEGPTEVQSDATQDKLAKS